MYAVDSDCADDRDELDLADVVRCPGDDESELRDAYDGRITRERDCE